MGAVEQLREQYARWRGLLMKGATDGAVSPDDVDNENARMCDLIPLALSEVAELTEQRKCWEDLYDTLASGEERTAKAAAIRGINFLAKAWQEARAQGEADRAALRALVVAMNAEHRRQPNGLTLDGLAALRVAEDRIYPGRWGATAASGDGAAAEGSEGK